MSTKSNPEKPASILDPTFIAMQAMSTAQEIGEVTNQKHITTTEPRNFYASNLTDLQTQTITPQRTTHETK